MAYRIDEYLDKVNDGSKLVSRKDKGFAVRLRADYQMPFEPLKLFVNLSHENIDSTFGNFDRTLAGLGAQLVF
ncbi:MAG: hypothetical protein MUC65_00755 [Pontiellaceae bacterium]|nr:hypothetical protein [Pontiellaceae bacterium]